MFLVQFSPRTSRKKNCSNTRDKLEKKGHQIFKILDIVFNKILLVLQPFVDKIIASPESLTGEDYRC
ncbi:MAG: hypothetical protein D6680_11030 [Cyanobacteria bacterium J007]|nr:MAG: hypothetical protein D6680_11030 [Cyanobacteria bacterium J007]